MQLRWNMIFFIDYFITQTMWPLMSSLTYQNKYKCFTKPLQPCLERFPWVLPQQKCGPVKTPHTITKMVFVLRNHGKLQLAAAQVTLEAAKASPSAPPEQGAPEAPRQRTCGGKKPKKQLRLVMWIYITIAVYWTIVWNVFLSEMKPVNLWIETKD